MIHFKYDSSASQHPDSNDSFFSIRQHSDNWNQNSWDRNYVSCWWINGVGAPSAPSGATWGKIYLYLKGTYCETQIPDVTIPTTTIRYNTSDLTYNENLLNHMEQDEEFVFVFRSGEHGRGNNNTGLSLRIYKKSDFFWNSLNPGYNTIQSKCDPFSQSEVTLVTNRGEGHDLWLNMAPPHIHPTSPRGVTDHGFEYKHVLWLSLIHI